MTNEELVLGIRNGQHHLIKDLYEQNKGIIYRNAAKYNSIKRTTAVDIDDLMQTGYISLAAAVERYDESKSAFITYLALWLKTDMRRLVGLDGPLKPHHMADSLDEHIAGTDCETTLGELIADDNAEDPYGAAELSDLQRIIRAAVNHLPYTWRSIIIEYYFYEQPLTKAIGGYNYTLNELRKALSRLRRDRTLHLLLDQYITPFYRHITLAGFKSSWCSTVEAAVFERENILTGIKTAPAPM